MSNNSNCCGALHDCCDATHNCYDTTHTLVENNITESRPNDHSASFDPMLLKVVTAGQTREEVITRMEDALRRCQIVGVPTNRQMLVNALRSERFRTQGADSRTLEEEAGTLLKPLTPDRVEVAHSIAGYCLSKKEPASSPSDPWRLLWSYSNSGAMTRKQCYSVNGNRYECAITTNPANGRDMEICLKKEGGEWEAPVSVEWLRREGDEMVLRVQDRIVTSCVHADGDAIRLFPLSCTDRFPSGLCGRGMRRRRGVLREGGEDEDGGEGREQRGE